MTKLLEKAIEKARKASADRQDLLGAIMLEALEADERWEALLADPRSEEALARLAAQAREEIERGEVLDEDPSDRTKT